MLIGMSSTGRNLDDQRVSVTRLLCIKATDCRCHQLPQPCKYQVAGAFFPKHNNCCTDMKRPSSVFHLMQYNILIFGCVLDSNHNVAGHRHYLLLLCTRSTSNQQQVNMVSPPNNVFSFLFLHLYCSSSKLILILWMATTHQTYRFLRIKSCRALWQEDGRTQTVCALPTYVPGQFFYSSFA